MKSISVPSLIFIMAVMELGRYKRYNIPVKHLARLYTGIKLPFRFWWFRIDFPQFDSSTRRKQHKIMRIEYLQYSNL